MMNEPVSSIMTKTVISLSPEDLLITAKKIFLTKGIRHIPIVDQNSFLLGIVSVFDLVKNEFSKVNLETTPVSAIMTAGIAKLLPHDKIGTATELFGRSLFHSLPVVDDKNILQGIITPNDVLSFVYQKEYPE